MFLYAVTNVTMMTTRLSIFLKKKENLSSLFNNLHGIGFSLNVLHDTRHVTNRQKEAIETHLIEIYFSTQACGTCSVRKCLLLKELKTLYTIPSFCFSCMSMHMKSNSGYLRLVLIFCVLQMSQSSFTKFCCLSLKSCKLLPLVPRRL